MIRTFIVSAVSKSYIFVTSPSQMTGKYCTFIYCKITVGNKIGSLRCISLSFEWQCLQCPSFLSFRSSCACCLVSHCFVSLTASRRAITGVCRSLWTSSLTSKRKNGHNASRVSVSPSAIKLLEALHGNPLLRKKCGHGGLVSFSPQSSFILRGFSRVW